MLKIKITVFLNYCFPPRLRFSLLKSILVAIRGALGKQTQPWMEDNLANISFNLIPYVKTYEGY